MTTTTTTSSGISQRTNTYAERQMLKHAQPVIVLQKLGMTKPMPKNKGVNIKFRRPIPFTAATTPLVEGVTPTATAFAYEDVSATLRQYGHLVEVTDAIADTHEDPVLNDAAVQSGENAGRTTEALTYAVVKAGTNVVYNNGSQRTDVNTAPTLVKIRKVIRALKAQKAMPITNILDGSINYKTTPVEAAFVAVCHTDLESDIRNLAGFTPVSEYGSRKPIDPNEFGTVENTRFITSADLSPIVDSGGAPGGTVVSTTGSLADIYPILFFGKEAFGLVPLRGQGSISPTILPPGKKDKADPLGQRGYVGWTTWFTAKVLNELWMARLECAATVL